MVQSESQCHISIVSLSDTFSCKLQSAITTTNQCYYNNKQQQRQQQQQLLLNSPKHLLYANCTALSFTEPATGLLPIEFLHCGNREFRVFLRKIVETINIFRPCRKRDGDDAETHFLSRYVCYRSCTRSRCCFIRIGRRNHFGQVT